MCEICTHWRRRGIVNFTYEEVTLLPRAGKREDPPPHKSGNIVPALLIAQAIRNAIDDPITARGYRPKWYNDVVDGSPTSEHMHFKAVDLLYYENPALLHSVAKHIVEGYRAAGWNVGLIFYDWGVHIDVDADPSKPRNRTLDYRS